MDAKVTAAIEILVDAARRRQIITYGELGAALGGLSARRDIPRLLWKVHAVCEDHGTPSLAALVVNQQELRPGAGYWEDPLAPADVRDIQWLQDLREVWRFSKWDCLLASVKRIEEV